MKRRFGFLAVFCAMLCMTQPALSQKAVDPLTTYDHELIQNTRLPIVLVEVKSIANEKWTNGNPPKPALKTLFLLRGDKHPFDVNAIWEPLPYDASWAAGKQDIILKAWQDVAMVAPEVKSRWYVTGTLQDGVFHVSPLLRYREDKAIEKILGQLTLYNMKDIKPGDVKPVEIEASRMGRLNAWQEKLKQSNPVDLVSKADYAVIADIADMQHDARAVNFTVKQQIKSASGQVAPTNIKMGGLSMKTYAMLYDYSKIPKDKLPPLVVFATIPQAGSAPLFIPVDNNYGIQMATQELLSTLGVKPNP